MKIVFSVAYFFRVILLFHFRVDKCNPWKKKRFPFLNSQFKVDRQFLTWLNNSKTKITIIWMKKNLGKKFEIKPYLSSKFLEFLYFKPWRKRDESQNFKLLNLVERSFSSLICNLYKTPNDRLYSSYCSSYSGSSNS